MGGVRTITAPEGGGAEVALPIRIVTLLRLQFAVSRLDRKGGAIHGPA